MELIGNQREVIVASRDQSGSPAQRGVLIRQLRKDRKPRAKRLTR